MKNMSDVAGHPLLAERLRLQLMVAIASATERVDFIDLLTGLNLTKGNLSSHLRKLEDAGLVEVEKSFVGRKSRTSYHCTEEGREALNVHLDELEKLILTLKTKAS